MKEIWKDIPNYEGYYQVSSLGRVRKYNTKKLRSLFDKKELFKIHKQRVNGHGYYIITLRKLKEIKTFKVHKLVAMAFLNHTPCGMEKVVNHINFNRLDNRLENLEIVSARENANQKHIKSSSSYTGVIVNKKRYNSFISKIKIKSKGIHLGYYKDEKQASEIYELAVKLVDKYNGVAKDFRELVKKEYEQNINRSNKLYK